MSRTGEILAQDYRSTSALQGQQVVIDRMVDAAKGVAQEANIALEQVGAVGIGAPGPMDAKAGILTAPPNLPGWHNVPLKDLIEARTGLPAYLENDANAAALAEFHYGAGQGSKNMIYVTASTGIGGGLILNRQLYFGSNGSAGEVGHMTILPHGPLCGCGNRGHLEALASGTAIAREARERLIRGVPTLIADLAQGDPKAVTAKIVAQAAENGDKEAQVIIADAMRFLGIGMANLANIFNPDFIVIGGGLANLGDKMFEPVRRIVQNTAFPVIAETLQIVPAKLGSAVGVIGAATVAISRHNASQ
jgi:glucokinase